MTPPGVTPQQTPGIICCYKINKYKQVMYRNKVYRGILLHYIPTASGGFAARFPPGLWPWAPPLGDFCLPVGPRPIVSYYTPYHCIIHGVKVTGILPYTSYFWQLFTASTHWKLSFESLLLTVILESNSCLRSDIVILDMLIVLLTYLLNFQVCITHGCVIFLR